MIFWFSKFPEWSYRQRPKDQTRNSIQAYSQLRFLILVLKSSTSSSLLRNTWYLENVSLIERDHGHFVVDSWYQFFDNSSANGRLTMMFIAGWAPLGSFSTLRSHCSYTDDWSTVHKGRHVEWLLSKMGLRNLLPRKQKSLLVLFLWTGSTVPVLIYKYSVVLQRIMTKYDGITSSLHSHHQSSLYFPSWDKMNPIYHCVNGILSNTRRFMDCYNRDLYSETWHQDLLKRNLWIIYSSILDWNKRTKPIRAFETKVDHLLTVESRWPKTSKRSRLVQDWTLCRNLFNLSRQYARTKTMKIH